MLTMNVTWEAARVIWRVGRWTNAPGDLSSHCADRRRPSVRLRGGCIGSCLKLTRMVTSIDGWRLQEGGAHSRPAGASTPGYTRFEDSVTVVSSYKGSER